MSIKQCTVLSSSTKSPILPLSLYINMHFMRLSIIAGALVALTAATLSPASAAFSDVQERFVDYLYEHNLVDGYPDGTFKTEGTINRAELIKMVMKVAGLEATAPDAPCFFDMPASSWYNPYVCTAKSKGWVEGYSDGGFHAGDVINRAEAVKIITNILGMDHIAEVANINPEEFPYAFQDVKGTEWYAPYVKVLKDAYYLNRDARFDPGAAMRRGTVAQIVFRNLVAEQLYSAPTAASNAKEDENAGTTAMLSAGLDLVERDFFRLDAKARALTVHDLKAAQERIEQEPDPERRYPVMVEKNGVLYGVISIYDENNEVSIPTTRGGYATWAIVAFDTATSKLTAYHLETHFVDRPSLQPSLAVAGDMQVLISVYGVGPSPTYFKRDEIPAFYVTLRPGRW